MNSIASDHELKRALDGLTPQQQRRLGGLLLESASDLCDDSRVRRAVRLALDPDASGQEREEAYRSAKAYAIESYTECGRDTDWDRQAAHFVANAAACLLAADETAGTGNQAWKTAMHLRNARNCASITQEDEMEENEAARQYRIANEFLAAESKR